MVEQILQGDQLGVILNNKCFFLQNFPRSLWGTPTSLLPVCPLLFL